MTGDQQDAAGSWRRNVMGILAIAFAIGGGGLQWSGFEGSGAMRFGAGSLFRLALVCGAIWLAWPSLQRPARWVPPGLVVVLLIGVATIAMQPRLVVAVVPAIGLLLAVSAAVRVFRRPR